MVLLTAVCASKQFYSRVSQLLIKRRVQILDTLVDEIEIHIMSGMDRRAGETMNDLSATMGRRKGKKNPYLMYV